MKVETLDITKYERMVKLLDRMHQEHGAVIVADPYQSHRGEWDIGT